MIGSNIFKRPFMLSALFVLVGSTATSAPLEQARKVFDDTSLKAS